MQDSSEVRANVFNRQGFGKGLENTCSLAKNHTNVKSPRASRLKTTTTTKNLCNKHNLTVNGCKKPQTSKAQLLFVQADHACTLHYIFKINGWTTRLKPVLAKPESNSQIKEAINQLRKTFSCWCYSGGWGISVKSMINFNIYLLYIQCF